MSFGTKGGAFNIGTQPPSVPRSSTQTSALTASAANISRLRLSLAKYAVPLGPPPSASTSNTPPLLPGYRPGSGLPGAGASSFDTTGGMGTRASAGAGAGAGAGEPAGPEEANDIKAQLDAQVQDATTPMGTPSAPQIEAQDPLLVMSDPVMTTVTNAPSAERRIPWAKIGIGVGMVIGVLMLLRRR